MTTVGTVKQTMCPLVFCPINPPNVTIGEMQAKKRNIADARHCMLMPSFNIPRYMRGL